MHIALRLGTTLQYCKLPPCIIIIVKYSVMGMLPLPPPNSYLQGSFISVIDFLCETIQDPTLDFH